MLGPFATASRFTLPFTRCRYCRTPPLSHAACASMPTTTTTTTTTTHDRGDRYGPMEWAQSNTHCASKFRFVDSELKCAGGHRSAPFHRIIFIIIIVVVVASISIPAPARACYAFAAGRRDPCVGRRCQYGARCAPTIDGRRSTCVCPTRCRRFGDAVGSKTVCASSDRSAPAVRSRPGNVGRSSPLSVEWDVGS